MKRDVFWGSGPRVSDTSPDWPGGSVPLPEVLHTPTRWAVDTHTHTLNCRNHISSPETHKQLFSPFKLRLVVQVFVCKQDYVKTTWWISRKLPGILKLCNLCSLMKFKGSRVWVEKGAPWSSFNFMMFEMSQISDTAPVEHLSAETLDSSREKIFDVIGAQAAFRQELGTSGSHTFWSSCLKPAQLGSNYSGNKYTCEKHRISSLHREPSPWLNYLLFNYQISVGSSSWTRVTRRLNSAHRKSHDSTLIKTTSNHLD